MGSRVEFDTLPRDLWAVRATVPMTGHVFMAHIGKTEEYARKVADRFAAQDRYRVEVLHGSVTWGEHEWSARD